MTTAAPTRPSRAIVQRIGTLLLALAVAVALLASLAPATTLAADPSPAPDGRVRMTAAPLLGGTVRPGAWMAVRVLVENDGPAISGELRITGGQQGDNRYGVAVELPTGARQEHLLYAQPSWFGSSLSVALVSGSASLLSQGLTTRAIDAWTPTIVVVAERPEGIVADVRAGTTVPGLNPPVILTVGAADLPSRVEAWSAIDRLVWQDVDGSALSEAQLTALRAWVGAGGKLAIVGGSTGTTTLGAFPADLLPFQPTATIDVSTDDLAGLLGPLPAGAAGVPAVSGLLDSGTVLGRSGDAVFAAHRNIGQGTVTVIGIDPSTRWLAGTPNAVALWRRMLPTSSNGAVINPLVLQDDGSVVGALANLPAVELPDLAILFALLLLYIALIGPINYLVLRRLDRREWAWVTMPALVVVFAVAAWGLGSSIKGTDTIVNQLGIVRSATGTDRGIGQYYVGVFSPTRSTYDVRVADGALLTTPLYLQQQGTTSTPLDVLTGETSRLRDFQVGFAVLRSFRAEAAVDVPRLDADLRFSEGILGGTVTNRSGETLESVAIVWGGAVQVLGTLAPGAEAQVAVRVAATIDQGHGLAGMVLGQNLQARREDRTTMTRRTVLDQVGWTLGLGNGVTQPGPLVLAWTSGPALGVDVGVEAKAVGDTLHLYPAPMSVVGPTVWSNGLLGRSIISSAANEAMEQGAQLSLSRGWMIVEFRPMGFGGPFTASGLSFMLTQGEMLDLTGGGPIVEPLPPSEQPPQSDPLGAEALGFAPDAEPVPDLPAPELLPEPMPEPDPVPRFWDGIPDMQLFDRVTETWVEFPHPPAHAEFSVASPARYVDETGALLIRYINRGTQDVTTWFMPLVRLEGNAG